jgi:hypothetical protein
MLTVVATGLVFGGLALGRQAGYFREQAEYHSRLENEASWPPVVGHALMTNGVCVELSNPESQQEKADRLGRLAHHARMRQLFEWLDNRTEF